MKLRDLRKSDFFTLKDVFYPTENQVWIRGEYDHSSKKYICYKFSDINTTRMLKGDKEVYTCFVF